MLRTDDEVRLIFVLFMSVSYEITFPEIIEILGDGTFSKRIFDITIVELLILKPGADELIIVSP
jgi:hypothetical protein